MNKLRAAQLRKTMPNKKDLKSFKRNPIYIVLDEIYDTYNVGSLFRLADAIAAKKVYLCGDMEYPPSSRIHKAAVGTENWVPWEKFDSTLKLLDILKSEGVQIIAVEQDKRSVDYRLLTKDKIKFPCALVVGNETKGLAKAALNQANLIVELPMMGINNSFNVWGSAAVIAYKLLEYLPTYK